MAAATLLAARVGQGQEHDLKLDLTPLLTPAHVFELTPESIDKEFSQEGFKENPYIRWEGGHARAAFSTNPFSNVEVDLSLFDHQILLTSADVNFAEGKARAVVVASEKADEAALGLLRAKISEMLVCQAIPGPKPVMGWKSMETSKSALWSSDKGVALLNAGDHAFTLTLGPPHTPPAMLATPSLRRNREAEGDTGKAAFFVRLDTLLAPPGLWNLTPAAFEESMKMPGPAFKQSPFYKWNTAAKDSLLLTRNVFSNTSTDLLLFDDAVNAEEALIEFRTGKAAKATLTLLTRGNSGEKGAAQFDSIFKATGRALGTMLKVQPIATVPAGRSLIKVKGYLWTTPHTLALMEFNEDAPKGQVEFLRLKLMPASGRAELLNLAGIG
ncbi:MAG: hypothetical protein JWO94_983, partial [Verrucomicrobiaceae bacterium]|nr:hypothetical protein [Verrucomicrobiaceae bacterium]